MWILAIWLVALVCFVFGFVLGSGLGKQNRAWDEEDMAGFWLGVGFLIALGKLNIADDKDQ